MKKIIFDLDDTLSLNESGDYRDATPIVAVIDKLRDYHRLGFTVVIHTSRNMRTHSGNLGAINKHTLPVILAWLQKHDVPFDEIYVGKPWCGEEGFYVDDKAIRPQEFLDLSYADIKSLLNIQ